MRHTTVLIEQRRPALRRCSRRLGAVDVGTAIVLCIISWAASEWSWLRCERRATAVLERDYQAAVIARIYSKEPNRFFGEQRFDLRELRRGRLYVPVTLVSFNEVTVDNQAARQLASFRSLESLTLQDCCIKRTAEFPPTRLGSLRSLNLWGTPVTISNLQGISSLRHLECLTLDGEGLKGDWLKYIAALPRLECLLLNGGDLTEGATSSLARMTQLTTLQLSDVKIDSKLAPAIARLTGLEYLWIVETPFDDKAMKHLTGLEHLKDLYLGGTAITDDGMASLEDLPNLSRLSLANTKIGDTGLRHLSHLPKLSLLDIRHTRATNSCLQTLAAMPSLKPVLVEGTRISKALPGFQGDLHDGIWYPGGEVAGKEDDELEKRERKTDGHQIQGE